MLEPLEIILGLLVILLSIMLLRIHKLNNYHKSMWERWEQEYWLLRKSDAIDHENYKIYLSWLPRGVAGCIENIGDS